ncbi:MAG: fibronectin type III domain-containing protein [Synergistetes bacterium]|nr:fibronectin type III domain-containing protein [Synergistota bacterium]MDW8192145.1 fibronectin type III domain-containing protein [Synergistota bacterium]
MRKGRIFCVVFLFFMLLFPQGAFSLPLPPSNLEAQIISPTHVRLTWWDNSVDEDGFIVERKKIGDNWIRIAILPPDLNVYNDVGLTPGESYFYRVKAYKGNYYTNYCELSFPVTTIGYPEPPSDLKGEALSSSEVELRWKDISDNEDGFIVERKHGSNWVEVCILPPNSESYVDTGLSENTKYTYRVLAFNSAGRTSSPEIEVRTESAKGEFYLSAGCSLREGSFDLSFIFLSFVSLLGFFMRRGV